MTIDVIDLAGDAGARGRNFGATRRQQIHAWMSDWLDNLRAAGVADPRAYVAQMLWDTDFLAAIRAHAPDLLEEVRGIASGAAQPFDLLLGAQFMDEEWAYRVALQGGAKARQKCSSVAIGSRSGPTWIGQNMDLDGYTDGHQVVMRIAPHAPEPGGLVFSVGGMIALMGVNARGVGVCVNALPQLPAARKGLPVAFVIRKLLQAENVAGATRIVHDIPHASGQHYLVADPTAIRSFEASASGVIEYHSPNPARVLHTNHPLVEELSNAYAARDQTNSVARLKSLRNRLTTGDVGLQAIMAALSSRDDPDHPVCRVLALRDVAASAGGTNRFTTGSMISALAQGPQTVESWVSAGPPSLREYTRIGVSPAGANA